MIGLGRAARVEISGRPSLPLSSAYAKDIYCLTPGNIYVNRHSYFVKLTQNKQTSLTFVRHFSPHAEMNADCSFPFQNSIIPSGLKCTISYEMF